MPIGTRVMLASGGPVMLVVDNALPDTTRVMCAWKVGCQVREAEFSIVCLSVIRS